MRSHFLFPLSLLLLCAACKKDEVDYDLRTSYFHNITTGKVYDTALTVMTYNIQCGFPAGHNPWNRYDTGGTEAHIDSLVRLIASSAADVVALQEVPLDRTNTVVKKLLDSLAQRLHMNYAFTAHGYNDAYETGYPVRGQWGNAIMSRYTIEETDSREVSYLDIWTRRSTLRARLKLNASKQIDVYSLHHKPMHDYSDLKKTADFVHESALPVIVCGDFNTGPDKPLEYLLLNQSLPPAMMSIDMIFHAAAFTALDAHAEVYTHLSDHAPIWVKLRY